MSEEDKLKEGQTIAEMLGVSKPDLSVLVPPVEIVAVAVDAVSAVVDLGEVAVTAVAAIAEAVGSASS